LKPFIIRTPRGERRIGPGEPVFVVAELSGNHNQSYDRAVELVDAAVDAGVDAIKLQTYTADTLTIDCDNEHFRVTSNAAWAGSTLYRLYEKAHTPWDWQPRLKARAEARGVPLFSTPFDETAVDFLETMNVPLYKVASFEAGDLALLRKVGSTGRPVILSRGLAGVADVRLALDTLRGAGAQQVAVLHCVSSYPAAPDEMNLRTIPDLAQRFDVVPGLSDHTLGTAAALAAVALGACIIEKHVTLSRGDGGPDAAFSLEPAELRTLVEQIRIVGEALGEATYDSGEREARNRVFQRSIFVVADVGPGEAFTRENIRVIRPGYGIAPRHIESVLGRRAAREIKRGTPLAVDLIEGDVGNLE